MIHWTKKTEVMFLLLHRWQAVTKQSAWTWHDYRWPWVSLTWLLYNLQIWHHRRWFQKFTVCFRPIRKERVSSMYNKQLLDEAFVISGIIKVMVSIITLQFTVRVIWWHQPRHWLFRISQKTNLIIVLLYFVLKKIMTNALLHRTQFNLDKPCSYFTVHELDIGLGIAFATYGLFTNLLADQWIICRLHCFPELTVGL